MTIGFHNRKRTASSKTTRTALMGLAAVASVGVTFGATLPVTAYAGTVTVQSLASNLVTVSNTGSLLSPTAVNVARSLSDADWDTIVFNTSNLSTEQKSVATTVVPIVKSVASANLTTESAAEAFVNTAVSTLDNLNPALARQDALTLNFLSDLATTSESNVLSLVGANSTNPTSSPIDEQHITTALHTAFESVISQSQYADLAQIFSSQGVTASSGSGGGSAGGSGDSTGSGASGDSGSPSTTGLSALVQTLVASFKTNLGQLTVGSGRSFSAQLGKASINVSIPAGVGKSGETVNLSTVTDTSSLQQILPGGYQVQFAVLPQSTDLSTTDSLSFTVNSTDIHTGTAVYALSPTGLQLLKPKLSAGQMTVSVPVNDVVILAQPQAAPKMKSAQRDIQLNGKVQSIVPAVVQSGTTYMPIWYVGNLLKSLGVTPHWDGANWKLTSTSSSNTNVPASSSSNGQMGIYLNGKRVENVTGVKAVDPSTGSQTTYMPIWYVMQILNNLNLPSQWDGHSWYLAQANPSIPQ